MALLILLVAVRVTPPSPSNIEFGGFFACRILIYSLSLRPFVCGRGPLRVFSVEITPNRDPPSHRAFAANAERICYYLERSLFAAAPPAYLVPNSVRFYATIFSSLSATARPRRARPALASNSNKLAIFSRNRFVRFRPYLSYTFTDLPRSPKIGCSSRHIVRPSSFPSSQRASSRSADPSLKAIRPAVSL